MSKFIELTSRKKEKKVTINVKQIVSFYGLIAKKKDTGEIVDTFTCVKTTNEVTENSGNTIYVRETTEEIKEKINSINKIA